MYEYSGMVHAIHDVLVCGNCLPGIVIVNKLSIKLNLYLFMYVTYCNLHLDLGCLYGTILGSPLMMRTTPLEDSASVFYPIELRSCVHLANGKISNVI